MSVRFVAMLREQRGLDQEVVSVPEGTTVAVLYASLFSEPRVPVSFAVNHAVVPGTRVLAEGDQLVFLPPVGGG